MIQFGRPPKLKSQKIAEKKHSERTEPLRICLSGQRPFLEDNSQDLDTWLIISNHGDRFGPLRIGLWDPFLKWPCHGL